MKKYLICTYGNRSYLVSADTANQAVRKFCAYCGYGEVPVLKAAEPILELVDYIGVANVYNTLDCILSVMQINIDELYGSAADAFYRID